MGDTKNPASHPVFPSPSLDDLPHHQQSAAIPTSTHHLQTCQCSVPRGRILWSHCFRVVSIASARLPLPSHLWLAQLVKQPWSASASSHTPVASKGVAGQDPTSARFSRKSSRHSAARANQTSALPILEQKRPLLWPPFCTQVSVYFAYMRTVAAWWH